METYVLFHSSTMTVENVFFHKRWLRRLRMRRCALSKSTSSFIAVMSTSCRCPARYMNHFIIIITQNALCCSPIPAFEAGSLGTQIAPEFISTESRPTARFVDGSEFDNSFTSLQIIRLSRQRNKSLIKTN